MGRYVTSHLFNPLAYPGRVPSIKGDPIPRAWPKHWLYEDGELAPIAHYLQGFTKVHLERDM